MKQTIPFYALFIAGFLMIAGLNAFAQDEASEPLPVDFVLEYWKNSEGMLEMRVNMTATSGDGYFPVSDATVHFFQITDTAELELGTMQTDEVGNARFLFSPEKIINRDTAGYFMLAARFEGDEQYDAAEADVTVREALLAMRFEIIDSVKTILVTAHFIKGDGEMYPVNDDEVLLFRQGIYSWLPVGDGWLVDGACEIPFPENLPGDPEGEMLIHLAFREHADFGNVVVSDTTDWGTIPDYLTAEDGKLWTTLAPSWMIWLLIILLSGVWGHYVYAVIQMIRIKQAGAKQPES